MFFKERVPEPKVMGETEMKVFEQLSRESYKRWFVPLVDDIFSQAPKGNITVLDVGCGPGLLLKEMAHRFGDVEIFGIDTSRVAIKMARRQCHNLRNVFLRLGNVDRLPFPSETFDLVVCKDSLHHFRNIDHALQEMLRVAKPGGLVYIQDLRRDVPHYLLRRVTPPKSTAEKLIFYSTRAAYTKREVAKAVIKLPGVSSYRIKTRKIDKLSRKRYAGMEIDIGRLREAFQSRYVASIRRK